MKKLLLLGLLPLAGCAVTPDAAGTAVREPAAATIHRSPLDTVCSLFTGRGCSVVRPNQGNADCRSAAAKPETSTFCTRTLGSVNCWQDPDTVPGHPHGLADSPAALTPEQEADRLRISP